MKRAKAASPVRAPSKQRLRLWLRLLRATRYVETVVRDRLKSAFATTLPRFDVLAALDRHRGGLTMTELSRTLEVSNGNVTGIVDRLVEQGLVVRVPIVSDRRATRVRLTASGRKSFGRMAAAHEQWISELLAEIPDGDTARMIGLLGHFSGRSRSELRARYAAEKSSR